MIDLDPSSPWGYERERATLHKVGDYDSAIKQIPNKMKRMIALDQVSICKSISRIPEVICADLKIKHTDPRVRAERHFVVGPPVEALFSKDRSVGFVYGIVSQNGI